ncbi:MAG: regulatory iron-sulfur-containing complex subunit RicT [Bacilli bacterium]
MKIVGVQFKKNGKIINFEGTEDVKLYDKVIVSDDKCKQIGEVKSLKEVTEYNSKNGISNILRVANEEDIKYQEKNELDSRRAMHKAIDMAKKLKLPMEFVDAFYSFDRTQLILYFIAESRVDFRELAKNLANIYKTRIELRQIGIRDKAKNISGLGVCGRQLCCSCFLNDLDSVTISMAKNQNLALNPNKINGVCGRLLCCLNYEDDVYYENRKVLPNMGEFIKCDLGEGKVVSLDILNKKYTFVTKENNYIQVNLDKKDKCDKCGKCNK